MVSFLRIALVTTGCLLTACGGIAFVDGGGNGGNSGGSGGSGNSGGWGGDPGGAGGICGQTQDGFSYSLTPGFGGASLDCSSAEPGTGAYYHLEGSFVQYLDSGGVLIDTCPPGSDCDGDATYVLKVSAADLFLTGFYEGMFVQLDVQIDFPWGCSQTLLVRNLPYWDGIPSSGGPEPFLLVAGSDGSAYAPEGAPFSISAVALGCSGVNMGCGIEDDYRLDFSPAFGPPGSTSSVYMGQLTWLPIPGEGDADGVLVRNLRSYETGWCDDYWNWAWWASYALPLD